MASAACPALLAGAYTFVPSTLGRLAKGKIGVGTLMTIAAVGAVILGEVGEAAMLAFLFSISEGLEERKLEKEKEAQENEAHEGDAPAKKDAKPRIKKAVKASVDAEEAAVAEVVAATEQKAE